MTRAVVYPYWQQKGKPKTPPSQTEGGAPGEMKQPRTSGRSNRRGRVRRERFRKLAIKDGIR